MKYFIPTCNFNSQCHNQYDEVLAFVSNKKNGHQTWFESCFFVCRPPFWCFIYIFLFNSIFYFHNQVLLVSDPKLKIFLIPKSNFKLNFKLWEISIIRLFWRKKFVSFYKILLVFLSTLINSLPTYPYLFYIFFFN